MKIFGEKLKELRKGKNLSQEEFGKVFEEEKSQSTIGTWERGDREPSMEDIIKIAQYFDVSIDYLFGLEEDRRNVTAYIKENSKETNDIGEFLKEESVEYKKLRLRKNEKELVERVLEAIFYQGE